MYFNNIHQQAQTCSIKHARAMVNGDCSSCKTASFSRGKSCGPHSKHRTSRSCMTRWSVQARQGQRKMVLQSFLKASVNINTWKPGKVSGIRDLIRGRSQWKHSKLLPCMIAECWCQVAALSPNSSNGH